METIEARNTLAGLTAFVAVVEARTFAAAAQRTGVSKGTISKRISALEDRLGVRLINRTTRRMSLTEAGVALHARCVRILADLDEAERSVADLHALPRGTLRLSAPMSFATLHLADAIPAFMAGCPDLKIDLVLNDRMVDLVEDGFDLGVRIATLADSTLVARKIAPSRRVVAAAPDYWARHGKPQHPDDLSGHSCLLYAYLANPSDWPFQGPEGPFSVHVTGPYAANNGEILCAAAVAGCGVSYAPTFILGEQIANGRLETALEAFEPPEQGIYAVYPQNRHLSAKVRLFVDFLVERFGQTPGWDRALPPREVIKL
jgi:DNA-binding transcriptional LysR family regulator